jgi:hypothetical protein
VSTAAPSPPHSGGEMEQVGERYDTREWGLRFRREEDMEQRNRGL